MYVRKGREYYKAFGYYPSLNLWAWLFDNACATELNPRIILFVRYILRPLLKNIKYFNNLCHIGIYHCSCHLINALTNSYMIYIYY